MCLRRLAAIETLIPRPNGQAAMILSFSVGRQERKAVNFAMTRLSINAVTKSLAINPSRNETERTSLKSDVGRVCSPKASDETSAMYSTTRLSSRARSVRFAARQELRNDDVAPSRTFLMIKWTSKTQVCMWTCSPHSRPRTKVQCGGFSGRKAPIRPADTALYHSTLISFSLH